MKAEQKRYLVREAMAWVKDKNPRVKFNKKEVNLNILEVKGVDIKDYPDFKGAFFSYGKYTDGIKMTKNELGKFTDSYPYLLYDKIMQKL
jgi:hypothetical protein|tara:strand:+ start:1870 stop:2139 length:270 start_codon:yes stop_codon:yes gene_type:complete